MASKILKKVTFMQWVVAIAILAVTLSVAYYIAIFIPQKERAYIELQENSLQEERLQVVDRETRYNDCLEEATERYRSAWVSRCEANNIEVTKDEIGNETCVMRDSLSESVRERYDKDKEVCLKIFLNE